MIHQNVINSLQGNQCYLYLIVISILVVYIKQLDTCFKKLKEMLFYFENMELKTWPLADKKQAPQKQSAQHGK